jgi:hypothetical protein
LSDLSTAALQRQICDQQGAKFDPPKEGTKVGVSLNVKEKIVPINGLRHASAGDTNGWYIWAGERLSTNDDFFQPLHVEHLHEWCPAVEKFLGLPPGWRFLIADNYEDVWFDESLLVE